MEGIYASWLGSPGGTAVRRLLGFGRLRRSIRAPGGARCRASGGFGYFLIRLDGGDY